MHQLVVGLSGVEVIADDFSCSWLQLEIAWRMHQIALVVGLSGVEVIADDFVEVGFGDSMEDASVGSRAVWCRGHS